MTNRFFTKNELKNLFDKNIYPDDISSEQVTGVTEVCDISLLIEDKKIEGVHELQIIRKFGNLEQAIEKGNIWVLELSSEKISHLLLDEDFYDSFCDKRMNPYTLSSRISMYHNSIYSYWTDNVYTEAFDQ